MSRESKSQGIRNVVDLGKSRINSTCFMVELVSLRFHKQGEHVQEDGNEHERGKGSLIRANVVEEKFTTKIAMLEDSRGVTMDKMDANLLKGRTISTLAKVRQEDKHPLKRTRICLLALPTPILLPPTPTPVALALTLTYLGPRLLPSIHSPTPFVPTTMLVVSSLVPLTPIPTPFLANLMSLLVTIRPPAFDQLIDRVKSEEYRVGDYDVPIEGDTIDIKVEIDDLIVPEGGASTHA
ncbi:hypothetical protein Ancab_024901 [Ancistrocladus abbreviatus]